MWADSSVTHTISSWEATNWDLLRLKKPISKTVTKLTQSLRQQISLQINVLILKPAQCRSMWNLSECMCRRAHLQSLWPHLAFSSALVYSGLAKGITSTYAHFRQPNNIWNYSRGIIMQISNYAYFLLVTPPVKPEPWRMRGEPTLGHRDPLHKGWIYFGSLSRFYQLCGGHSTSHNLALFY